MSECSSKCTDLKAWAETRMRARDAFINRCLNDGLWAWSKERIGAAQQQKAGGE